MFLFSKSLKNFYKKEVQCWLNRHHARPVTEYQIAEFFSTAYANTFSGFCKTDTISLDPDIFSEKDFVAANVSE